MNADPQIDSRIFCPATSEQEHRDQHRHRFEHIGGGTFLATRESDDRYRCFCGAMLTILSSADVHETLPEVIESRVPESETPAGSPGPRTESRT